MAKRREIVWWMVVPLVPQFAIHYVISKKNASHCAKNTLKVLRKVFSPIQWLRQAKVAINTFSNANAFAAKKTVVASCAVDELYPFSWVSIILTLKGIKFMMCSSSVHCRKFFVEKLKLFFSFIVC